MKFHKLNSLLRHIVNKLPHDIMWLKESLSLPIILLLIFSTCNPIAYPKSKDKSSHDVTSEIRPTILNKGNTSSLWNKGMQLSKFGGATYLPHRYYIVEVAWTYLEQWKEEQNWYCQRWAQGSIHLHETVVAKLTWLLQTYSRGQP